MKVIRTINIEDNLWKLLDEVSKKEKRSKSNMIEYLIAKYLKDFK